MGLSVKEYLRQQGQDRFNKRMSLVFGILAILFMFVCLVI